MRVWLRAAVVVVMLGAAVRSWGQASAIPSAQGDETVAGSDKGRKLLDQMVEALGGPLWLNRQDMVLQGRLATFYKGQPHEGAPGFEEYYRFKPFAERVILVSHFGVFIATDHKDLAEVFTPDAGYEVTYQGKKALPVEDVQDYQRRRAHSLETVVNDWLKQPGVLVTYEGAGMVERRYAEQVSVLTTSNDAVTLNLDATTHLPLSLTFQWRDPVYKDLNTDVQEFDDYHMVQGIATAYSITLLHNGDMTGQRFLTKVAYNSKLAADLFDPDRPLEKSAKGRE